MAKLPIAGFRAVGHGSNRVAGVTLTPGGSPETARRFLVASNLAAPNWSELGAANAWAKGSIQFTDETAAPGPARFYRANAP